jgi:hypothetical protein
LETPKVIKKLLSLLLLATPLFAGTYTDRMDLYKPDVGERNYGALVNTNFDIIDASVGVLSGTQTWTGTNTFNLPATTSSSGTVQTFTASTATVNSLTVNNLTGNMPIKTNWSGELVSGGIDLENDVFGTMPISNGGTGLSGPFLTGQILAGDSVTGRLSTTTLAGLSGIVNVKDFGALGDGLTDDTAAIQAAHDSVVASGIPSTLLIPAGTYVCSSTLTFNLGYVNVRGEHAVLDFSEAIESTDFVAVNITGAGLYFGTPWYQTQAAISGLRIQGPSKDFDNGTGLYFFTTTATTSPAHVAIRDVVVEGFKHGVRLGSNSYLLNFYHTSLFDNTTGFYAPSNNIDGSVVSNTAENISYFGGSLFANHCSFFNENGSADFSFHGTSFDYSSGASTAIVITNGQLHLNGTHHEDTMQLLRVTGNTYVTATGSYFLGIGDRNVWIQNSGYISIYGGRLVCSNGSTNCLTSDNRATVMGMHFQTASASPWTLSAKYMIYPPNDGIIYTNEVRAIDLATVEASSRSVTHNFGTSNQFFTLVSTQVAPGHWTFDACVYVSTGGANVSLWGTGIGTSDGNNSTGLQDGNTFLERGPIPTLNTDSLCVSGIQLNPAVYTTYYLKMRGIYSGGPPTVTGRMSGRKMGYP